MDFCDAGVACDDEGARGPRGVFMEEAGFEEKACCADWGVFGGAPLPTVYFGCRREEAGE